MKKTIALAIGFVLVGVMAAAVQAGKNDGLQTAQSGTSAQSAPQKGLSRRNQAVIEQSEMNKMRRDQIQSEQTGTMQKKGLSKRNKAVINQAEAAKKRRELIQSGSTSTKPK